MNLTIKYRILIYSVLIISSTLVAFPAVKNIKLTHDSFTYALVSQQIVSGNGIRVPTIWLDSNAVPVDGTIPMLLHPPLLPIVLAILGSVTSQNYLPAQLLNLVCHVAMTIFTFLLMKLLYNKQGVAILTGMLVSISFPLLKLTHHMWSEPLFIALTVATIFFITTARLSNGNQYRNNLFLASLCASAMTLTRHAGLAILAVFFWEMFILIKNKRPEAKSFFTILTIALPAITPLIYYSYSYRIAGRIQGYVQWPAAADTYFSAFTGMIRMLFQQFELGPYHITLIVILLVVSIGFILLNSNSRRESSKYFHSGLDLIIIFIVSYLVLICVALTKRQPVFELRFMAPLVPFLYIITIFIISFVWRMIKVMGFSKLSLAGVILSLGIIAFGTGYKTFLNFPEFFQKQERFNTFLDSCSYNWIIENYEKNIVIASNRAHEISFFGGYSTVIFPNRRHAKKMHISEDMESFLPARMSEIGAKVLSLIDVKNVKDEHLGDYLTGLYNKDIISENFKLVYECSDGVVYEMREQD